MDNSISTPHNGLLVGEINEGLTYNLDLEEYRKESIELRSSNEVIVPILNYKDIESIMNFLSVTGFYMDSNREKLFCYIFEKINKKKFSIIISNEGYFTIHGYKDYLKINLNSIDFFYQPELEEFIGSFISKANKKYNFDESFLTTHYQGRTLSGKNKTMEGISKIEEILFPKIKNEQRKRIIDSYIKKRNLCDLGEEEKISEEVKRGFEKFSKIKNSLSVLEKIYINQRTSEYKKENKMFHQKQKSFYEKRNALIHLIENAKSILEKDLNDFKRNIADLVIMNLAKTIEKKSIYQLKSNLKYRTPDFLFDNHGTSAEWSHIYIRDSEIKPTDHVLEMFTGPGTVANSLSLFPVERIYAADIDPTIDFSSNFHQWISYLNLFPEIIRPEIHVTPIFILQNFLENINSVPNIKVDKIIAEPPFGRYTSEIGFDEIDCIDLMLRSIFLATKILRDKNSIMVIRFPREWMDFMNQVESEYYKKNKWEKLTLDQLVINLKKTVRSDYEYKNDKKDTDILSSIKYVLKAIFDEISLGNFNMSFFYLGDQTLYFKKPNCLS